MRAFSKNLKLIQTLHELSQEQCSAVLSEDLVGPLYLITNERKRYVAISEYEIRPLKALFIEPPDIKSSPFTVKETEISVKSLTVEEFMTEEDVADHPVNGGAALGTEPKLLYELLDRLAHLRNTDLIHIEDWVWIEDKPYPLTDGQLNFFDSTSRDWFKLPNLTHRDSLEYFTGGDKNAIRPKRFAITHPTGLIQAFTTNEGFVGPPDFIWLKPLDTSFTALAQFEGTTLRSLNSQDASLVKNLYQNHEEKISSKVTLPLPALRASHTYGMDWQNKDLTRLTATGYSLLPGACCSGQDADHVLTIIASDGNTIAGPWYLSEDGRKPKGPGYNSIKTACWGFSLRKGLSVRDGNSPAALKSHWIIALKQTGIISEQTFTEPPTVGAKSRTLIGPVTRNLLTTEQNKSTKFWGAIDIKTGGIVVPFKFKEYHYSYEYLIFTAEDDRHQIFDAVGYTYLKPLKTFEYPNNFPASKRNSLKKQNKEKDCRKTYIEGDLSNIHEFMEAEKRYGKFDLHASRLGRFTGEILSCRDAKLAGLWGKKVEIAVNCQRYEHFFTEGKIGEISYGDTVMAGDSLYWWLSEIPVTGLFPENPGRAIGIPYSNIRLHVSKEDRTKNIIDNLVTIRWCVWIFTSLSFMMIIWFDNFPFLEILVLSAALSISLFIAEKVMSRCL